MTLILRQVFKLFQLLNSDTGTNQIAAGVACGLILGFAPAFSLQTVLVILAVFFFRVQLGVALATAFFFAIPAYLLDPAFHLLGSQILEMESLRGAFTVLYNLPIIPFTRFNNSVVMGAGVLSLVFAPFVYLLAKKLVFQYREQVVARFRGSKFWKLVQATRFYKWYAKYQQVVG